MDTPVLNNKKEDWSAQPAACLCEILKTNVHHEGDTPARSKSKAIAINPPLRPESVVSRQQAVPRSGTRRPVRAHTGRRMRQKILHCTLDRHVKLVVGRIWGETHSLDLHGSDHSLRRPASACGHRFSVGKKLTHPQVNLRNMLANAHGLPLLTNTSTAEPWTLGQPLFNSKKCNSKLLCR